MLSNLLSNCGLNHTEQTVFLHLLQNGPSIASVIAKRTKLKRPTVYAVINNLIQYGLVILEERNRTSFFSSVSPSLIPQIIENRARYAFDEVKIATQLLSKELEELGQTETAAIAGYKIIALDSLSAVYAQLEDALTGGDFDSIFNPQKAFISEKSRQIVLKYLEKTSITQPHIREIAVAGKWTDWYKKHINNPNEVLKEIAGDIKLSSDMIFMKDSIVLTHYEPNNENSIKIIHKEFYQSMRSIFELLWEKL